MKKVFIFSLLALSTAVGSVFAQSKTQDVDMYSKRGVYILPEAGDFSIGIDATPFLEYGGNMFNGTVDNDGPSFTSPTNNASADFTMPVITGKYFLTDKMAIRGGFAFGSSNTGIESEVGSIDSDVLAEDATATVTNTVKTRQPAFYLSGGLEWRRGKGRVQGFYGAEVFVETAATKTIYEYGNSTDTHVDEKDPITRDDEVKDGYFTFGAQGFAGVEYFFAPKMSLAGQVGYALMSTSYNTTTEYTTVDADPSTGDFYSESTTDESLKNTAFDFGTNFSAGISLNFYF